MSVYKSSTVLIGLIVDIQADRLRMGLPYVFKIGLSLCTWAAFSTVGNT